jgi:hypothetical protein
VTSKYICIYVCLYMFRLVNNHLQKAINNISRKLLLHMYLFIYVSFVVLCLCKVTVKLSLCLNKYHSMKTNGGSACIAPPFLTSLLDGDELSASSPGPLIPDERTPVSTGYEGACAPEPIWMLPYSCPLQLCSVFNYSRVILPKIGSSRGFLFCKIRIKPK